VCAGHTGQARVRLRVPGNAKAGFTALLGIRADGVVLRTQVIAKGKTNLCEKKFGASRFGKRVLMTHTAKGWTTELSFIQALEQIVSKDSKVRAADSPLVSRGIIFSAACSVPTGAPCAGAVRLV
jgi:hypothetical protein